MHIQWKYLDLEYQQQTGMVDLEIGRMSMHLSQPKSLGKYESAYPKVRADVRTYSIRIMRRSPVNSAQVNFVDKTQYRLRFIVHPIGARPGEFGNAMQIVCERCGAVYPFAWSSHPTPCGFCAVERQSGIVLSWGTTKLEKVWSYGTR